MKNLKNQIIESLPKLITVSIVMILYTTVDFLKESEDLIINIKISELFFLLIITSFVGSTLSK